MKLAMDRPVQRRRNPEVCCGQAGESPVEIDHPALCRKVQNTAGAQLVAHDVRNVHAFEKSWRQVDLIDQDQGVVWDLALDLLDHHRVMDVMRLEEPVELMARLDSEPAAHLGFGQTPGKGSRG